MKALQSKVLKTPSCILRPFTMDDAEDMFSEWCQDPLVTEFLSWEPHTSIEMTKAILKLWVDAYNTPHTYRWAIVSPQTHKVIGSIDCVKFNEQHERAEIGYALSQTYWNQGIMTDALHAVMHFLFTEVGVNRIMARHYLANPKSGRVMEKCDMVKEGIFREFHKAKDGTYLDMVQYGIIKKDHI
jgi:RimJ/RimL family protein N-acetyltransferase